MLFYVDPLKAVSARFANVARFKPVTSNADFYGLDSITDGLVG